MHGNHIPDTQVDSRLQFNSGAALLTGGANIDPDAHCAREVLAVMADLRAPTVLRSRLAGYGQSAGDARSRLKGRELPPLLPPTRRKRPHQLRQARPRRNRARQERSIFPATASSAAEP